MYRIEDKKKLSEIQLRMGKKKTHHRTRSLEATEKGDLAFLTSYCYNDMKAFYKDKIYAVRVLADKLEVLATLDVFEQRLQSDWSVMVVSQPLADSTPVVCCIGAQYYSVFTLEKTEDTGEYFLSAKGGKVNCFPKSKMHRISKMDG